MAVQLRGDGGVGVGGVGVGGVRVGCVAVELTMWGAAVKGGCVCVGAAMRDLMRCQGVASAEAAQSHEDQNVSVLLRRKMLDGP